MFIPLPIGSLKLPMFIIICLDLHTVSELPLALEVTVSSLSIPNKQRRTTIPIIIKATMPTVFITENFEFFLIIFIFSFFVAYLIIKNSVQSPRVFLFFVQALFSCYRLFALLPWQSLCIHQILLRPLLL